jgi:hypothetical protein
MSSPDTPALPPAGLCTSCTHARIVTSSRGSAFLLCQLSTTDPRFPRYPALPVWSCAGFNDSQSGEPRF